MSASSGNFLLATRQNYKTFQPLQYSPAGITPQQVPQSGFGAGIWLLLTGTVAATGNATMATWPVTPFSLIKNISLVSSDGTVLCSLSGWELYLYNRTQRTGWDPARSPQNFNPTFTDPFTRTFQQTGNMVSGDSKTFRCMLWYPITWGRNWQEGLILLQNSASTYTLNVTWGSPSDLFSVGSGNVTLSNVQIAPTLEFASIPTGSQDLPNISYLKQVVSQQQSVTATGVIPYLAPTGNMYTKLISYFVNNGLPMDMSKITQFQFSYSQTQFPYIVTPDQVIAENIYNYGGSLPAATYVRDFSLGNGFPEIGTYRDVINTARVTNFEFDFTLDSSLSLASATANHIREQLLPVRR